MSKPSKHQIIGKSLYRKEGIDKIIGKAVYTDDLEIDCLYGKTIRSSSPRGRIRKIHFKPGIPWDEFIIVTPDDIIGENKITLIDKSQPFLADKEFRHAAEPLALIAHANPRLVQKALSFVEVELEEELPAMFTIEESLSGKNIQHGEDNVFTRFEINHGNPEEKWAHADLVFEETYRTKSQEQLYIEPQVLIAQSIPGKEITIRGSLQCPYYIQKALSPLFNIPQDKIRVIQMATGGAFGGKEEYPNMLAGHAALLSWKAGGKAVKMIYDRTEDLWATPKRHPSRTRVKGAFSKDGKILGLDIDFILDGGAYTTLSATVLSRGLLHSFGPYVCNDVHVLGRVVMTNSAPHGAFRGFGAPQSVYALELFLDEAAGRLGMDSVALRKKNILRQGNQMATTQEVIEKIDLEFLLNKALKKARYEEKKREFDAFNKQGGSKRRGMGVSLFFHGSGFTGSGEAMMGSKTSVRLTEEGGIEVLSSNVEFGQGTNTAFTQIASETCGIPADWIRIHQPDTAEVPNSGPTVASRTTMIVGKLVENASKKLLKELQEKTGLKSEFSPEAFRAAALKCVKEQGGLIATVTYEAPKAIHWDDQKYQGEAYSGFAWCCDVAEVEVDLVTYLAECKNFVSVVEAGRVINPIIATGQIEGGVAQGIGYALCEDVILEKGTMSNRQYTNYIIPTTADIPPIDVEFIEFPFLNPGPFSAKGIGELPADGPAPAIAAAVAHALGGHYIREIPLLPEVLMKEWEEKQSSGKGSI